MMVDQTIAGMCCCFSYMTYAIILSGPIIIGSAVVGILLLVIIVFIFVILTVGAVLKFKNKSNNYNFIIKYNVNA